MVSVPVADLRSVYSIDVECVACGRGHLARSVAQIALVVSLASLRRKMLRLLRMMCFAAACHGQWRVAHASTS